MNTPKYKKINEEKYQLWRERVMLMEEEMKKMEKPKKFSAARIAIEKHKLSVSAVRLVSLWEKWKKNDLRQRKKVLETRGRKGVLSDRLKKILFGILGERLIRHEVVNYKLIQEMAQKYFGLKLINATTERFVQEMNLVSKPTVKKPHARISLNAVSSCIRFRDEVTSACTDTTKLYAMDETALYNHEIVPKTLVEKG